MSTRADELAESADGLVGFADGLATLVSRLRVGVCCVRICVAHGRVLYVVCVHSHAQKKVAFILEKLDFFPTLQVTLGLRHIPPIE